MASHLVDWNSDETSGLISIGTHKLFLKVAGPPRTVGQPIVLVEAGFGDNSTSWSAVQHLVAKFARILTYDRAGYGRSDPGPDPRSAQVVAEDLSALLVAAKIAPPYVVVCHSYGGVLGREFLARHVEDVVGMVFVDANQEKVAEEIPMPFDAFGRIVGDMDYLVMIGLDKDHKMGSEGWKAMKDDEGSNQVGSKQEMKYFQKNSEELAKKHQFELQVLGEHPVVVIKGNTAGDFRKFYKAAREAGNVTVEDGASILETLHQLETKDEPLQREHLMLSSRSRWVQAENGGHNLHISEPNLIASEIEKILKEVRES